MALNAVALGQDIYKALNKANEKQIDLHQVCQDLASAIVNHFMQFGVVNTTVNTTVATPQGPGTGVGSGVGKIS